MIIFYSVTLKKDPLKIRKRPGLPEITARFFLKKGILTSNAKVTKKKFFEESKKNLNKKNHLLSLSTTFSL